MSAQLRRSLSRNLLVASSNTGAVNWLAHSPAALYTFVLPPSSMPKPRKPLALVPGSTIAVVAPASSAKEERIQRGCETLERLDYRVTEIRSETRTGRIFFGSVDGAAQANCRMRLTRPEIRGVLCSRGGYGSAEILDGLKTASLKQPKDFLRLQRSDFGPHFSVAEASLGHVLRPAGGRRI